MVDFKKLMEEDAERDRQEMAEAEPAPDLANAPKYPQWEFITGAAGTGKTFMMKERLEADPRGVQLCATTGIAAVNLGDAITLNSFLKFFDTRSLQEAWTEGRLTVQLMRAVRAGLRNIIVDEVSMMDGDQLTVLVAAIEEANEKLEEADDPQLTMTLTGDFCQLPPVKAKFAFEVEAWERFQANTLKLTEIRRQADRDFIEALQAIRRGEGKKGLEFFAPLLQEQTDHDYDGCTIVAKNEAVDRFNLLRMSKISATPISWEAQRWGKQRPEWERLIPNTLAIKPGALVMVLANKKKYVDGVPQKEFEYVNGDLGILEETDADSGTCWVTLRRTGKVHSIEACERKILIPLEPGRRKEIKIEHPYDWDQYLDKEGKKEAVGGITYMPLRVAYATTVHKSQGLSLDEVQINIRDPFFASPGMLYVALSRCRSAAGLRLVGNANGFLARCTVDRRVKRWL